MKLKNLSAIIVIVVFSLIAIGGFSFFAMSTGLPRMITLEDYKPLLISEVFARDGQKIGEFRREKRIIIPYKRIPTQLIHAFISAEDSSFFKHKGINYSAILRAAFANLKDLTFHQFDFYYFYVFFYL